MKNVKIRGIFVFIIALLLCPDICAHAKKFEYRYETDRPQGYYKIDENEELVVSDETLKVTRNVKKDGVAYGMGQSESVSFEFTDRYSKPYKNVWINKPVELMKNVKHVYGSYEKTILMTRDNKLYWTGEQGITYPYWW